MKFSDRACPACSSTDSIGRPIEPHFDFSKLDRFAFASRKVPEFMHLRMVVCAACDLLYATPIPDMDFVENAYEQADFDASVESRYAALTYSRHLPAIVSQLPDRIGALDIGAGDGAFIAELLRAGFTDVEGLEPSTSARGAAPANLQQYIRQGFFDPKAGAPARLSLISCFQTLEHVRDPSELFAAAAGQLKPGGALFTVVHNRRGLLTKLLGTRSPIFDIEHLQLFSSDSLRALYRRFGFERISVEPLTNRYPLSYWIRLTPLPPLIRDGLSRLAAQTGIGRLAIPVRAGNLIGIGYRAA